MMPCSEFYNHLSAKFPSIVSDSMRIPKHIHCTSKWLRQKSDRIQQTTVFAIAVEKKAAFYAMAYSLHYAIWMQVGVQKTHEG